MKKLPISKFDLGMIIAFVVVTLLGGGAWWYLSGQLAAAQQDVTQAKSDFDKYSSYQGSTQKFLVSNPNLKVLQQNIDLLKGQISPLIENKLTAKQNKLSTIEKKDPVAWKHDLDDEVRRLTAAAGVQSVKLPPNFYFTFSRYLNQNPDDEQTVVLSKQLLAVEQITTILINAPVKSIINIQRTFEEDAHLGGSPANNTAGSGGGLGGYSIEAPGGAYRAYPFEFEFETTTAGFRKIMNDLIQSPYVFVVRTLSVQNQQPNSPRPDELDKIAGSNDTSVVNSSPGTVASTVSTKGPQYIFGNATLRVKARIDLIEWTAPAPDMPDSATPSSSGK